MLKCLKWKRKNTKERYQSHKRIMRNSDYPGTVEGSNVPTITKQKEPINSVINHYRYSIYECSIKDIGQYIRRTIGRNYEENIRKLSSGIH